MKISPLTSLTLLCLLCCILNTADVQANRRRRHHRGSECTNPAYIDSLADNNNVFLRLEATTPYINMSQSTTTTHDVNNNVVIVCEPERECPTITSRRSSGSLEHRSTCPWKSCSSTDSNRIPRVIIHAVCLCDTCQGHGGAGHQCEEIIHHETVLRRVGCKRGQYVWRTDKQRVVVGCTCAVAQE